MKPISTKVFTTAFIIFASLFNSTSSKAQYLSLILSVSKNSGGASIQIAGFDMQKHNYWISDTSLIKLDKALHKALEWTNINEREKLSFTKDICTTLLMEQAIFNAQGYNINQTDNMTISFNGYNDGKSVCDLNVRNPNNFSNDNFYFNENGMLYFISKIEGTPYKPENSEVDEIFH